MERLFPARMAIPVPRVVVTRFSGVCTFQSPGNAMMKMLARQMISARAEFAYLVERQTATTEISAPQMGVIR